MLVRTTAFQTKAQDMPYDTSKYKILTWKSPLMLHWIINPGLAINELLLGQRVPKVTLIEKDPGKSLAEKTFIPCPHCGTLHPGQKWSNQNKTGFKNWFGLYCDQCGQIIPCLTNLTSYLVLGLTFPIWYGFKDQWKANWLAKQPARYANLDLDNSQDPFAGSGWIQQGLVFGMLLYVIMVLLFPLITGEGWTTRGILIGIPVWLIGGLAYGYMMKFFTGKRKSRA